MIHSDLKAIVIDKPYIWKAILKKAELIQNSKRLFFEWPIESIQIYISLFKKTEYVTASDDILWQPVFLFLHY